MVPDISFPRLFLYNQVCKIHLKKEKKWKCMFDMTRKGLKKFKLVRKCCLTGQFSKYFRWKVKTDEKFALFIYVFILSV